MIVSLWQGPIVWGHRHEQGDVGLANHIHKFHDESHQSSCLGWHWHCSLLSDVFPASSDETDTNQNPQPKPRDLVRIISFDGGSLFSVVGYLSFERSPATVAVKTGATAPHRALFGFLSTFDPAHASQYVLCRMTC